MFEMFFFFSLLNKTSSVYASISILLSFKNKNNKT